MAEEWRPVVREDVRQGYYEVSNLGRVRNARGYVFRSTPGSTGYVKTDLVQEDGTAVHISRHLLVAGAFIPRIEGKPYINHIDGKRHNNLVSNLEWVTASENGLRLAAPRKEASSIEEPPELDGEVWRDLSIDGFVIPVSSLGRVRKRKCITRGSDTKASYKEVCIIQSRRKTYLVHALVCRAFHGPPEEGQCVWHVDRDPRNNAATNLAWKTKTEMALLRRPSTEMSFHRRVEQLDAVGNVVASFNGVAQAAYAMGLANHGHLAACCRRQAGTAAGFGWRFESQVAS